LKLGLSSQGKFVSENRAPRRIFGPKRGEVAEGRRKLQNEEFHNLYFSPHIVIVIESRRMR
jgi:PAS domain-containing protein